jgi:hypothetical protein
VVRLYRTQEQANGVARRDKFTSSPDVITHEE